MKSPHTNVLVRMTPELKEQLQARAAENRRSVTQEILERLKVSLAARGPTFQGILTREAEAKGTLSDPFPPSYTAGPTPTLTANDNGPAPALSDLDRAMLDVFHAMPVEKQLALLSLFKP